eukprot:7138435-Karenia_brevis.AAC.1
MEQDELEVSTYKIVSSGVPHCFKQISLQEYAINKIDDENRKRSQPASKQHQWKYDHLKERIDGTFLK